jgi:hypothetical protein
VPSQTRVEFSVGLWREEGQGERLDDPGRIQVSAGGAEFSGVPGFVANLDEEV